MDIMSTAKIPPRISDIFCSVSTAILCWDCFEVRKKTRRSFSRPTSRDAVSATAVFPRPVGACAMRCPPEDSTLRASRKKLSCPFLGLGKGKRLLFDCLVPFPESALLIPIGTMSDSVFCVSGLNSSKPKMISKSGFIGTTDRSLHVPVR